MSKDFRIILERQRCIGSENCLRAAPNTFDIEDGAVVLKPAPHDDEEVIREAVEYCPVAALRLAAADDKEENP